ncbi:LacI family DNA-binding transcriptional regulator [Gelidibacter salicanalis]|uniref:LacI family DNA-binding transcriptional regulator n=1 Tax=Gelidibacter salicanalis TaxID=291193 RepID=A0A934NJ54_9FLAO|nr:LacI family DNA-binding transcriptional regulator [Gelidibacter salicanalis]MBJ7882043.1 LacI family DNA-binding transcriptional regulator [Gelidibacter salicanalis]
MMEVTMKTLSKMSGYSVSTVSKALRDKKDISLKTRRIIKELAESCDFVPNNSAIALRSQKSNTIAVIVPQIDSKIYGSMLNSIQHIAFEQGYRVVVQQYLNGEDGAFESLKSLRNGGIDGIILIGTSSKLDAIKKNAAEHFMPTVVTKIENSDLKSDDYKHFGKKIIHALLSKIEALSTGMQIHMV